MAITASLSGWGGYLKQEGIILSPTSTSSCKNVLVEPAIARGMGRSYGDSAVAATVLSTAYFDHFIAFDKETGVLTAEAGVTLRDILNLIVPAGWFLPVTPGTSFVTLGGAIASDVHGKNHHVAGTFAQHVSSIEILLGSGNVVKASPTEFADLFHATCGGMGLTGIILSATIRLIPIRSSYISRTTIKASCIDEACEQFEARSQSTYSVAWIDCLAKGRHLGRSVLMLGEHRERGDLSCTVKELIAIPVHTPAALVNKTTIGALNALYYTRAAHNKKQTIPMLTYFYPLDAIGGWNRLYGKEGFVQYQIAIPKDGGIANLRTILTRIAESGEGSFLSVLKQFGSANQNLLSFPISGYTLALDFKASRKTVDLLHQLDDMVIGMGGRIYLAKDALMTEATFKSTYTRWQEFEATRDKYGAIGKFSSAQSQRLGLA